MLPVSFLKSSNVHWEGTSDLPLLVTGISRIQVVDSKAELEA